METKQTNSSFSGMTSVKRTIMKNEKLDGNSGGSQEMPLKSNLSKSDLTLASEEEVVSNMEVSSNLELGSL